MAALQDATNEGQESLENNLFSWANPSPLFRGLVNAIASVETTDQPPAEQDNGVELGGLGADGAAVEGEDAHGDGFGDMGAASRTVDMFASVMSRVVQ